MNHPTADSYLPGRGDPTWSATHYDLDLTYAVVGNRLDGTARISLRTLADTDRLVFDLAGLKVRKVTAEGVRVARFSHSGTRLTVRLAQPLAAASEAVVTIRYDGRPGPVSARGHGEAGWEELTDGVIVAGQPHGAPTWFPCNDRADDKAPYSVRFTAPSDYTVVCNGDLVSKRRGGSTQTWTYEQPEPMASYLATVQVGRYRVDELEDSPVPMYVAYPPRLSDGVKQAFGAQPAMLRAFTEWFGTYPFARYTAVVTDDELEIPLESQSLATFGANHCTADWDARRLVAHELAHQWFGNAVTLSKWRDIWLHEGFACYSEWLWSAECGERPTQEWAEHHHTGLARKREDLVLSDPGPADMFDDRVYKRGALTLHALRCQLGDDSFFGLLQTWVAEHLHRSVSTDDFRSLVARVGGEPATDLLSSWLDESDLPELPMLSQGADPAVR